MQSLLRLIIVILFFTLSQSLASQSLLDKRISCAYEDESIKYILRDLNIKNRLDLKYNADLIPNIKGTYSFEKTRLRDILNVVLKDIDMNYLENNGNVILAPRVIVSDEEGEKNSKVSDTIISSKEATKYQVGSPQNTQASDDITFRVRITDIESYTPIADAVVLIKNTGEFTVSDITGEFDLTLPQGSYSVEISALSHETILAEIDVYSTDLLELNMTKKSYLIDEVVISGKGAEHNVRQTITGLELLSKREIKQLPSFMGEADLIKGLLSFSGVSTIGEGASGFNVRGGSIDQNLITQDGSLIFNPSHVLGFFSIFNPDIVRNSALYKGHIPAEFGGRISSVLDVNIREANMDHVSVSGSVGLIASKLSLDLPIIKDKTSLLLSGRSSYSKYLIGDIRDFDVANSDANFYDLQAKLTHKFNANSKLLASYYQSSDRFKFSDEFGYGWKNRIANIQYKHIFNESLSWSTTLSYGALDNEQFSLDGSLAFLLESGMAYTSVKSSVLNQRGSHIIKFGVEGTSYTSAPERLGPFEGSQTREVTVEKENGREMAIFVNDQYELTDRLSLDGGLRFSYYQQIGPAIVNSYENEQDLSIDEIVSTTEFADGSIQSYSGIEPRLSLRYALTDGASIKMSYNRLYQYIHLISNTATPTPVDVWQVSNTHIKPLIANNYSIGFFGSINDNFDLSTDFYYKQLDNTIDFEDFSTLLLNPHLETAVVKGIGRAYGAEVGVEKINSILTGKLSYSYARSERKTPPGPASVNRGTWFPSNFDQPHTVKANMNWKMSKQWSLSANFVYNTGRPITGVSSNYLVQNVIVTNFSDRNNFRLPDYHRLDLSLTYNLNRNKSARFKSDLNVSLYNVYARRNAFSIFYRQLPGSLTNAYKLSVVGSTVPSINYSFKW